MPIRVIAGTAKGRKLKLVPGDSTRPIMDKVKEALFNIIGRNIYGAVFLDLFAGTGSVGIEALSRGAAKAVFVDLERKAIETIQDNLTATKFSEKAIVKRANALTLVSQAPSEHYDFVYIAPPQYKNLWLDVMEALDANIAWISDDTQFIVQIDPTEESTVEFKHLKATDQRRYGNTLLWFFAKNDGALNEKPVEG